MGKKEDTPLQASVKENDTLKKSIDKFVKSSESQLKKKTTDRMAIKELHERCNDQITEIESQIQHVTELTPEDDPSMKENKFISKKKDEVKKLNTLKDKLTNLGQKLKPDETEEGYFEEMKKEHGEEGDAEDEETEEEDDEESGEDEWDDESEAMPSERHSAKKTSARTPRGDMKPGTKKAVVEEIDEESEEEEDLTEDEEDDMTDVTEDDETEAKEKKPLPQKQKAKDEVKTEVKKSSSKRVVQEEESEEEESEEEESGEYETETEDEVETEVIGKDDETEDEETEDDEEDLESEEDEEGDSSQKGTNRQYEAVVDFEGEQEGDLSFHAGEILTIISARTDGWLDAENSAGKRGLVPVTYLKVYNKYKSLEKPKEEEEEEEEDSEELSEEEEGMTKTPRSGRMLWKNIKQAVKEKNLSFLGLVQSTPMIGEHCTLKAYLAPKLSPSCLSYRDLNIDNTTNRIRARASRVLRIIQLVSARQIPAPGTGPENKNLRTGQKGEFDEAKGLDIKSRHVRVCLFDGHSMLSNIHTMAVASVDKDQRTWHFTTKINENMKSLDFGECFIRTNTTETNIGLLFELGMSYIRRSTQQAGEFSCGWVFLPLYDKDGRPAEFKSYDEFVSGGTPWEKGVDVDPSVGRRENSSMFRSLVGGNKQPRLNFRLLSPTKDQKELLDTLPDVLISSTVYIQYLSFYRQILTDAVIRDNEDLLTSDNIHNGVLTSFPGVSDQSDLMDVLRQSWAERMRTAKRAEKKDPDIMKEQFKKVFMESVYPLLHATKMPQYKATDPQALQERSVEIKKILKLNKEKKFVASLLSSDIDFKPFDVSELAFNVIGPHCVAQKHRVH